MEDASFHRERIKGIREVSHDSPSNNVVDSTRFVCFQGIKKQRLEEVRKSPAALKVETKR